MSMYSFAKDDILLQSKHADEVYKFSDNNGWILFFYNQPKKGKSITVDYTPENWPAVHITIRANWKARAQALKCNKDPYAQIASF